MGQEVYLVEILSIWLVLIFIRKCLLFAFVKTLLCFVCDATRSLRRTKTRKTAKAIWIGGSLRLATNATVKLVAMRIMSNVDKLSAYINHLVCQV